METANDGTRGWKTHTKGDTDKHTHPGSERPPSLDWTRLLCDRHRFFHPRRVALVRPSHCGTHTRVSMSVCACPPLYERCGMDRGTTSQRTQTHTGMSGWYFFFPSLDFHVGFSRVVAFFSPLGRLCVLGDLSKKHFDSAGPFLFKLHCDLSAGKHHKCSGTKQTHTRTHTRVQEHALAHLTRSTTEQSLYVMQSWRSTPLFFLLLLLLLPVWTGGPQREFLLCGCCHAAALFRCMVANTASQVLRRHASVAKNKKKNSRVVALGVAVCASFAQCFNVAQSDCLYWKQERWAIKYACRLNS